MYENAKSCVRLNGQFTDEFNIKVGFHQGVVPSPLLFIIVIETTYKELKAGCHRELLYADDLVLMTETLEGLKKKLTIWEDNIEAKRLRVNVNKTNLAACKHNLSVKWDLLKWPYSIYRNGVGSNSIFCQTSNHWVHIRCSKIKRRLKADPSFKCYACTNNITISQDDPEKISGNDKSLYVISSVSQEAVLKQRQRDWEKPGRISTVCFQHWQTVASRWKIGVMHTMPVLVVFCSMLVKFGPLKKMTLTDSSEPTTQC